MPNMPDPGHSIGQSPYNIGSILNPHSNVLISGKRTSGTGLNGSQQPQSIGKRNIYNPLSNQRKRNPVS